MSSSLIVFNPLHPCSLTHKRVTATITSNISSLFPSVVTSHCVRAIDQAVSCRISTAEAKVPSQVG
jgi:hypothetical protein